MSRTVSPKRATSVGATTHRSTSSSGGVLQPTNLLPPDALNKVCQCSRCGTLTMLPTCPKCDIPTYVPMPANNNPNVHQGGYMTGPQRPVAPSPVRTSSVGSHQPGYRSTSNANVVISPAPTMMSKPIAPMSPVANAAASAARTQLDRIAVELHDRQLDLQQLKTEANTTAMTKHELQELWRTIDRQKDDGERSRLLQSELRSLQNKYDMLLTEKDRWMQESLAHHDHAQQVARQSAGEVERAQGDARQAQLKYLEMEGELSNANQRAQEAESALDAQKTKVHRATEEVKELQHVVSSTRAQDRQEISNLQAQLADLDREYQHVRSQYEVLMQSHESLKRSYDEEAERHHEKLKDLDSRLHLAEIEQRAAQDEAVMLKGRVVQTHQEREASRARRTESEDTETREVQRRLYEAQDLNDLLTGRHRQAVQELDALRDKHSQLQRESEGVRKDLEKMMADRGSNTQQALAHEDEKRKLREQINELRLEVVNLNKEAEASYADSQRRGAGGGNSDTPEFEQKLLSMQRAISSAKEDILRAQREGDEAKQKHTQTVMELNTARQTFERSRVELEDDHFRKEQQMKMDLEDDQHRMQNKIDELRTLVSEKEEQLSQRDLLHSQTIAEVRRELIDVKSSNDALTFECDRLKANSPSKVARQTEELQSNHRKEKERREDTERRLEEHRDLLDTVRQELLSTRQEANDAKESFRKLDQMASHLCATLRVSNTDDILPSVSSLLTAKEAAIFDGKRQLDSMTQRVSDAENTIRRLTTERDKVQSDADEYYQRWKTSDRQMEIMKGELEHHKHHVTSEAETAKEKLSKDLESVRLQLRTEVDIISRECDTLRSQVLQGEDTIRQLQQEKAHQNTSQLKVMREMDEIKTEKHNFLRSIDELKMENQGQQTALTAMTDRVRDVERQMERFKQDKERLMTDVASMRSTTDSEVTETKMRCEEQTNRYAREMETLRATVRMERDKVLREVEATHVAALRVSELELSLDSAKAEKERYMKELELSKRSQTNKADTFHHLVDEISSDRDGLRQEMENLRRKSAEILKENEMLKIEKRGLESKIDEHCSHRDMALRQLEAAKNERDTVMRNMVDFKNIPITQHSTHPPPSSTSGAGLHYHPENKQVSPHRISPPKRNHSPPRRPPLTSTSATTPPTGIVQHFNTNHPASHYYANNVTGNTVSRVWPAGGQEPSVERPMLTASTPSPLLQQPVSAVGKMRSGKNDELFAHFREQQHGANLKGGQGPRSVPSTRESSVESMPLGAYRHMPRM